MTTPSTGDATWFISFITSTMATVSPAETFCPTSTKGGAPGDGARQNSPTEGDSIRVPSVGVASAGGGVAGDAAGEEALATGAGGSPTPTGPARRSALESSTETVGEDTLITSRFKEW